MNKSIEYIKNTILNRPETINIPKDGWDKAIVINPMKKYKELEPKITINNNKFEIRLECDQGKFINTIEYNPNAEFDYFTTERSTHDGTLIFTLNNIQKILIKILKKETYYTKIPQDVIDNPFNYNYKYIIGDIIIHQDFGIKNINGNKWPGQTDTLVLPIKFEYSEKEN